MKQFNELARTRLVGYGDFNYSLYLCRYVGFTLGLGLVGKGARYETYESFSKIETWYKAVHFELPIGFLFQFGFFRLGLYFVPNVAISAKFKTSVDNEVINETDVNTEFWDSYRKSTYSLRSTIPHS